MREHETDEELLSDDDDLAKPKKKQKRDPNNNQWRKQKFVEDWLEEEDFKGWLQQDPSNMYKSVCSACNCSLTCGKSELKKHARGKGHLTKIKMLQKLKPITKYFEPISKKNDNVLKKTLELKLCLFFAEHNVAFQIVEHLLPLLKQCIPDSEIIKNVKLGRKKSTSLVKNVLAEEVKSSLINVLQSKKFSVLIDESTDIGLTKTMCVLARYINSQGQVSTELLDLIKLNSQDCSALELFKAFKNLLDTCQIPIANVIGMASDGASVMIGKNNSFASRLLQYNENVIVIKCICHSAAIIAAKACLALPRTPEELLRQIATYFSASSKRCAQLEEFQEFFQMQRKKILRPSTTRWLSLHQCVVRTLELWEVFINYFRVATIEDKLKSAEQILTELENMCTKAYLTFLKYVLIYFNKLNALFQSKAPLIQVLHIESKKLFLILGQNFIKPSKLHVDMIVRQPLNYLNDDEIFLGNECKQILENIPNKEAQQVKMHCLEFYIVALEEIQKRLPLKDDSIFNSFQFLEPSIAIGTNENRKTIYLNELCKKIGLDVDEVLMEWRNMPYNFNEQEKEKLIKLSPEEFWYHISKARNFENKEAFPNMSAMSKHVLTLPHANADAERIFSIISDVRTKKRNKLSHEVLNSICIIRSMLQNRGLNCVNFDLPTDILNKIKYKTVYDHYKE